MGTHINLKYAPHCRHVMQTFIVWFQTIIIDTSQFLLPNVCQSSDHFHSQTILCYNYLCCVNQTNLPMAHKVEDMFISSLGGSTSSPSTTPTPVPDLSPPNHPPSPIQKFEKQLDIPFMDPSTDFMSQLMKQLMHEIHS